MDLKTLNLFVQSLLLIIKITVGGLVFIFKGFIASEWNWNAYMKEQFLILNVFSCEYPRKFTECYVSQNIYFSSFFFLLQLLTSNIRLVHVFFCLKSLSHKNTFNLYPIQIHPISTHLQLGSFYWFLCINIKKLSILKLKCVFHFEMF